MTMVDVAQKNTKIEADPSALTTSQIIRENIWLRELIETRLNAMDKAIDLLNSNNTRVPTDTDRQIKCAFDLVMTEISGGVKVADERFKALETRITERDTSVKEAKQDAQLGIKDALASAEKLVGQANDNFKEQFNKSENSTGELLKKQGENQNTEVKALRELLGAVKERMDRFEAVAVGSVTGKAEIGVQTQQGHANISWVIGLGVAAIAVIEFIARITPAIR